MKNSTRSFLNDKDRIQSEVLDWLRFPLIVLVVFLHCPGTPDLSNYDVLNVQLSNIHLMDVYNFVRISISYVLSSIAVPTFFVISGYYFFYGTKEWNKSIYKKKLKKRWKSLAIPYLIWNIIAYLFVLALKLRYYIVGRYNISDILNYIKGENLYKIFWAGIIHNPRVYLFGNTLSNSFPLDGALWYIRDLMVCVSFSFLIYKLIKYFKFYILIVLGFCYVTGLWLDIPGFGINSLFFFSIGAYFSINNKNMLFFIRKGRSIVYLVTLIFFIINVRFAWRITNVNQIIYCLFIIFGVWTIINVAYWLNQCLKCKIYPILTESVFFIYAFHQICFVGMYDVLLGKCLSGNLVLSYLRYFLTPIMVVLTCFVSYILIKRFFPRLLKIMVGGR